MNKNSVIKEQSGREISTLQRETTENKEQWSACTSPISNIWNSCYVFITSVFVKPYLNIILQIY